MGFDNHTEANSYWWQAWSSVRLAQDCYVFINRFTQMLILLFNRAIYLNLGWLPCLLQQILIKVRCLPLVCELFLSGQKEQFGIGKELHVLRSSWGRPSSVWKRHCYLHFIGGVLCQEQMLTWCTAAVSCKLPFYSSICFYQFYWRLDIDMEKVSPGYLMICYGCVIQSIRQEVIWSAGQNLSDCAEASVTERAYLWLQQDN